MYCKLFLALAIVGGWVTSAQAITTITAGDHSLLPNTPNQKISILISDDAQGPNRPTIPLGSVRGVDLVLFMGGGTQGPIISQIDFVGPGTIFHFNNNGQHDFPAPFGLPGRHTLSFTSAGSGFVAANGVLAFLTLDTTGIAPGVYSLALSSDDLGPSDTGSVDPRFLPTLFDGRITVVPEPASIVMGLMGAAVLGAVLIRNRRRPFKSNCN